MVLFELLHGNCPQRAFLVHSLRRNLVLPGARFFIVILEDLLFLFHVHLSQFDLKPLFRSWWHIRIVLLRRWRERARRVVVHVERHKFHVALRCCVVGILETLGGVIYRQTFLLSLWFYCLIPNSWPLAGLSEHHIEVPLVAL